MVSDNRQDDLQQVKAALEAVLANDALHPRQRNGLAGIAPYWTARRTINKCWKAWKDEPWANISKCRTCVSTELSKLVWKIETDIANGK